MSGNIVLKILQTSLSETRSLDRRKFSKIAFFKKIAQVFKNLVHPPKNGRGQTLHGLRPVGVDQFHDRSVFGRYAEFGSGQPFHYHRQKN